MSWFQLAKIWSTDLSIFARRKVHNRSMFSKLRATGSDDGATLECY